MSDIKKPQAMPETSGSWVASPARRDSNDSTPAHVGECPVMTMTTRPDGSVVADRPWERFAVIDDALLVHMARSNNGEIRIDVANGWARYRFVGKTWGTLMSPAGAVWELVESEWEAPTAAAEDA